MDLSHEHFFYKEVYILKTFSFTTYHIHPTPPFFSTILSVSGKYTHFQVQANGGTNLEGVSAEKKD